MLLKFGSQLKIEAAGLALEDVMVVPEKPSQKVLEPKHSDHIYFRARAISAGDQGVLKEDGTRDFYPNGNGDFFGRKELEASYESFVGRNLFLNHESDHPIKSVGKIIDAYAVEDPETKEFYIECLSKIDRKLHPEIARKVETGELNTVSMGCSCEQSMCSICGTTINSDMDEKCSHLSPGGLLKEFATMIDLPEYGISKGTKIKAFSINSGLNFNELSIVNVPADSKAFIKTIISNLKHQLVRKASLNEVEQINLLASMETILNQLDEKTRDSVKAEFCSCSPVKEGSVVMSEEKPKAEDKKVEVSASNEDEVNQILKKLNGYEFVRLMSSLDKKENKTTKKAAGEGDAHMCKECEKPIAYEGLCSKCEQAEHVEGSQKMSQKEETLFQRVADKVFKSFAGKIFTQTVKRIAEEEVAEVKKEAELPAVDLEASYISKSKAEDAALAKAHSVGADYGYVYKHNGTWKVTLDEDVAIKHAGDSYWPVNASATGPEKEAGLYGKCSGCDKPLKMGEERVINQGGMYYHPGCVPKEQDKKAQFNKNENVLESSWNIMEGDKVLLSATLGSIWGDEFESNKDWATSEEYGKELLARFEAEGVDKVSELLGVTLNKEAHTVMDVKTETKIDMPAKKDFVKPGTETKADKEADKTEKALEKVDQTEVGEHLESSKPREDREASKKEAAKPMPTDPIDPTEEYVYDPTKDSWFKQKKAASLKKADEMPLVTEEPKPEEVKVDVKEPECHPELKNPTTEEEDVAAAKEVLEFLDGLTNHETAENEPKEVELLEKAKHLVQKFLGEEEKEVKEEKPLGAPAEVQEKPKEEVKVVEMSPEASKKELELTKKAEELKQKEAELEKQAAKINAEKFSATVNTRTEACKHIVEAMVEREMLEISDDDLEAAMNDNTPLLEARKIAFEKAVNKQLTTLLGMDDTSLKAFATGVNQVKKIASKSQKVFTIPLPTEDSVETEIKNIFASMGSGYKSPK